MIDLQSATQVAITGLTGVVGVFGSSIWVRRWIEKTDARLDEIQSKLTQIQVNSAKVEERIAHKDHCYELLRKEISDVSVNTVRSLSHFNSILKQTIGKDKK